MRAGDGMGMPTPSPMSWWPIQAQKNQEVRHFHRETSQTKIGQPTLNSGLPIHPKKASELQQPLQDINATQSSSTNRTLSSFPTAIRADGSPIPMATSALTLSSDGTSQTTLSSATNSPKTLPVMQKAAFPTTG
mmetsp:Transcript_14794/g.29023  ORF Transcript_14794/g.29023 Transcript_14794/m.29023 type:complete len:134 (+) Transcript_14794:922-1323(+)